jgi:chlorobactene glucosyltransferase
MLGIVFEFVTELLNRLFLFRYFDFSVVLCKIENQTHSFLLTNVFMINSLSQLEITLYILIFIPLIIFLVTASLNAIFGPFFYNKQFISEINEQNNLKNFPLVSILVPARNEAHNIEKCINSLVQQDYPNYEIIILDDNSSDNTYQIASEISKNHTNIKILKGKVLKSGWLGKNWACHQLFEESNGEYLIFTDADNWYEKYAISKTIEFMKIRELDMFSVVPQQITKSFAEKLIIPIIDLIIYSGLILWTTFHFPYKAFAAANGQWIAFKRETYILTEGHSKVKTHIVEDIALSRLFKSSGKRILTGAGTGFVYGRMYKDFKSIWYGLSKSIFGLTEFKAFPFFILIIIVLLTSVLPYIFLIFGYLPEASLLAIIMNLIWRSVLALRFKHNLLISLFFHPISILIISLIGINSFRIAKFSKFTWKDRYIKVE